MTEQLWKDPGKSPRLFVEDRVVFFHAYYTPDWAACVMAQLEKGAKEIEVQWFVGNDPDSAPVQTDKVQLYSGKGDEPHKISSRLYPNDMCDETRRKKLQGRAMTTGLPGKEQVSQLVPVHVRVKAAGNLARLEHTSPSVEIPCAACDSNSRGQAMIRVADNGRDLVYAAEADRAWSSPPVAAPPRW